MIEEQRAGHPAHPVTSYSTTVLPPSLFMECLNLKIIKFRKKFGVIFIFKLKMIIEVRFDVNKN